MSKTVGLSRNIKLQWLNKAVDLLDENLTEEEYKAKMNDYLSYEIDSPTNIRKTREILMRIWVYDSEPYTADFRECAIDLLKKNPDQGMAIHWCMMLVAFPVFADLCRSIGRIAEFGDLITLNQLKQKLYDEWGERSTLFHSTDKIIATMKEFGVITAVKPGKYEIIKHHIFDSGLTDFMLCTAMAIDGNSYYSFHELYEMNLLFPFAYTINKEALLTDDRFTVSTFGGETSVSLRTNP